MWNHIKKYTIYIRGVYTIHDVNMIKYKKYPSILILKHANILDEVIKSHNVNLIQDYSVR